MIKRNLTPTTSSFFCLGHEQQVKQLGLLMKFNKGLHTLLDEGKIQKAYGIYQGNEMIQKGKTLVIPAAHFSSYLTQTSLFS